MEHVRELHARIDKREAQQVIFAAFSDVHNLAEQFVCGILILANRELESVLTPLSACLACLGAIRIATEQSGCDKRSVERCCRRAGATAELQWEWERSKLAVE